MLWEQIDRFEAEHPEIRVRTLYKETEELRSAFQAVALAGTGPELVYGPSDPLATFQKMGIVQDMAPWVPEGFAGQFLDGALTYLPTIVPMEASESKPDKPELLQVSDRFGNHLALVYNRNFVAEPPKTTDEMIEIGQANTVDLDGDGRMDRYGLVFNFIEPFFSIPFLTGYGGWVYDESGQPALDSPEATAAYAFILSLQDEYRILPRNCDYETADALFKNGQAAMIINGDWSWADYMEADGIDAAIAHRCPW